MTVTLWGRLRPPVAFHGSVARQPLLDQLAGYASAKLVLVVAPAGWGKTWLLRDWCRAGEKLRTTWLSVDQGDNDPAQFWAGVVAAVDGVSPGIGAAALQVLQAARAKTPDALMRPVINDLARMPERVTLVLDDFHLITNAEILEGVAYLVQHLPPTLGLVVASRSQPSLPLARLRAGGELAEIRADDLRFSEGETRDLLNGTLGLALPPEDIHALLERTEGWAAGLYLAGLSLRGHKDPARFIRGFGGDDRQIADYLSAEVLSGQTAEVRTLLLRTSVLDRFSGPLCDAITDGSGSQSVLEELERSQLFLEPLDTTRNWYRYHRLFAELLRHELHRSEPGLAPLLHQRASAWHRQNGSIGEAIDHAVMASDLDGARELIAGHSTTLIDQGLAVDVESWLDRLPREMIIEDARMCLIRGSLGRHLGRPDDVKSWLAAAQAAEPQGRSTEESAARAASIESAASVLWADYYHLVGDLASAEAASRWAAEVEAAGTAQLQAEALAAVGANLFWRAQDAEARMVLEQVAGPTRSLASNLASVRALSYLAAISARAGDLEACERHVHMATDLASRHSLGEYWITTTAMVTSAELSAARGELTEAETTALAALECARRGHARLETASALLCLAKIRSRAGYADDAKVRLGQASDVIGRCAAPGILTELLTEAERLAGRHVPAPISVPAQRSGALPPDTLTRREAQVLELLAAGRTNNEIAVQLVVSIHTVERHLQNAYRKIGVRNRADAAAYIVRTELQRSESGSS
ncbi:MAG TPA: LuxR C-terminal-related transcriptional regulator [Streptosporangiaceae bacterium]|nr:LuxR C-terminal-related transcriptional regulator [Streptosporangiaceae bacterium]